jgi:hypothetical protein
MFKTQYKNIKINMNFYFMIIKIVSIKNKNDLKKINKKIQNNDKLLLICIFILYNFYFVLELICILILRFNIRWEIRK